MLSVWEMISPDIACGKTNDKQQTVFIKYPKFNDFFFLKINVFPSQPLQKTSILDRESSEHNTQFPSVKFPYINIKLGSLPDPKKINTFPPEKNHLQILYY